MTEQKYNCPEDCALKGQSCPIGTKIPPMLVRDKRVSICPFYMRSLPEWKLSRGIKMVEAKDTVMKKEEVL